MASALAVFVALACAGCTRPPTDDPNKPPPKLPRTPPKLKTDTGSSVGQTQRWLNPPVNTTDWQVALAPIEGEKSLRIRYRVPQQWSVDRRGRGRSGDGLVQSYAYRTELRTSDLSASAHAAHLADGGVVFERVMAAGGTSYLVVREVSIAPSDPNVERMMYHTALAEVDGRIVKLEVRYRSDVRWRFREVANAVIGSMEIVPKPGEPVPAETATTKTSTTTAG